MRPLVVFSGAGLSADSGIPTFRDTDGLWENHKVEDVAEHQAWFRDKELVLKFYEARHANYMACQPHAGHYALARLEEKFTVTHVTQNIDDLLEQAGCTNVRHLHGRINSKKCEWHKDIPANRNRAFTCDYKAETDGPVQMGDWCPRCGGQMRPDVVWFNESVDFNYDTVREMVRQVKYENGVFICVGTSVQVFPAGYFVSFFSQVKEKYIIDPKAHGVADYELIKGGAAEQLPILVERLLNE